LGVATSLSTFPNFAIYFVSAVLLTALFLALYTGLTPHREIRLIRDGNVAAAITVVGGLLGFVIPLAGVIAHSASLVDVVIWGVIALVIQIAGFMVARLILPHLPQAIEDGSVSDAIFLAGLSLALGILDAACMAG
jgi:putative membrane protein